MEWVTKIKTEMQNAKERSDKPGWNLYSSITIHFFRYRRDIPFKYNKDYILLAKVRTKTRARF